MELKNKDLKNAALWTEKGFYVPSFDREAMIKKTEENPKWIHFGAGNIFRGYPAALMQHLIETGEEDTGIIVGEGFDYEIIEKIYDEYDNLTLLVVLNSDGSIEKRVISSVAAAYPCDSVAYPAEWKKFQQYFENPSLQMVSFTITEKGYALKNANGYFPFVQADLEAGPMGKLNSMMSKITALLYHRYLTSKAPLAVVSMDNCSHNGEKLQNGVMEVAKVWVEKGYLEPAFIDYMNDKVSFPWSMIDKITPRPDASVKEMLEKDGFESTSVIVTGKNTYIAPFVNAEKPQYLVIEDNFPNGRPALEKSGVYFTTRDTVNKVEKMKVCTCLNPLHTTLAIYGCLLGHTLISAEMKDPQLSSMVRQIGYNEGMPVVVNPGIIDPKDFIAEVLDIRFPNPFMPDTPQRIATDTSQKLSIRFGETVKAYMAQGLNLNNLKLIPLVMAGWCRYVMGINDEGEAFACSPDPMLASVQPLLAGVKLGDKGPFDEILRPILSNTTIWGVDIYEAGLAEKVVGYFTELVAGPHAVRNTLIKYVG
jgi:Mannitol-1-phosphate/altronate dehydrogenases